ncbi:NADPH-dependent FMN reductase [Altericroceibacterium xinjiangense]|uniref:NADPH-dependent FMN reductase n=1 Tax=Altericroceibacterium xinjiangense TaxID=762261 RepID=UPI000F7EB764|nr:NAD(P)H-dependent oxidoreductase [Altericroceibacterium xinjiangense]
MARTYKVAVVVGSLRKESINRKAALALAGMAPDTLDLEIVEIGDLPLYDEDAEAAGPPQAWERFRREIAAADAVLFVTPEYNRSIPGALKNAVDVASRPYGSGAWSGKPAAVMSISAGAMGGFGANHQLRQALVFLDMPVLQQPEAYVGGGFTLFDEQGEIAAEGTRAFFQTFIDAFANWIERTAAPESGG